MKTTNYFNTFIEVAEDCPVKSAEVPPQKGDNPSIANIQFDMIAAHPYLYNSDDVIFKGYATKNNLVNNIETERELFFSKGQACLRCSPLTKRYGWGVHSNSEGKVAVFPMESAEYRQLADDENVKHIKAMRSKRV